MSMQSDNSSAFAHFAGINVTGSHSHISCTVFKHA